MLASVEVQIEDGPKLRLVASEVGIRAIEFVRGGDVPVGAQGVERAVPVLVEGIRQLQAYFRGGLREFDLPLEILGTPFQVAVWRQLLTIPFGETRSYLQVAQSVGRPAAVRAVGAANGANPIAIVVPCHRVIGASGKLVGYGGGLPLKKRLLALEGVMPGNLGY